MAGLAKVSVWSSGQNGRISNAPRVARKEPILARDWRTIVGCSAVFGDNIQIARLVDFPVLNPQPGAGEQVDDRGRFPPAENTANERVVSFQSGQVVYQARVEHMTAVEVSIAAAGARVVTVRKTGRGVPASERRFPNILGECVARLEL